MKKLKTRKAILKRFKITGKQKFLRRFAGQNHFNAKESGRTTRRKRTEIKLGSVQKKIFRKGLPYI